MKRKLAFILIAIAAVVVAFLLFQPSKKQRRAGGDASVADSAIPVTAASAAYSEFRDEISAIGTLSAVEISPLSPKVAGTVSQVLVDIGGRVKVGDVVVQLDRTNFDLAVKQAQAALAAAEAAIQQAQAQFEQAEKEYLRATELLEKKVIAQSRFDAAEAAFKTAREAALSTRGQRDQAKAAVDSALQHLKDSEIRTPIDGAVVERNVELGQAVAPGQPVLLITNQTSLKGDVDLPEGDLGSVAIGAAGVITVDAFPKEEFSAKVIVVNPMVDRQTRTFRVRIEVPNEAGKLVDGMFAKVKLLVGKRRTLSVPRDALQRLPGSGTYYVYVVDGNNAVKRTVQVGMISEQFAEVSDGVAVGEKVVTSGAGRLRSGIEVDLHDARNGNEPNKSAGTTSQEDQRGGYVRQ